MVLYNLSHRSRKSIAWLCDETTEAISQVFWTFAKGESDVCLWNWLHAENQTMLKAVRLEYFLRATNDKIQALRSCSVARVPPRLCPKERFVWVCQRFHGSGRGSQPLVTNGCLFMSPRGPQSLTNLRKSDKAESRGFAHP